MSKRIDEKLLILGTGWHLLIFLLEAVIGRPVSLKIRERAQQIGVFIIIFIMLLVFYNDISRIIGAE